MRSTKINPSPSASSKSNEKETTRFEKESLFEEKEEAEKKYPLSQQTLFWPCRGVISYRLRSTLKRQRPIVQ